MRDPLLYLKSKLNDWARKQGMRRLATELDIPVKTLANEFHEYSPNKLDWSRLIECMEVTGSTIPLDYIAYHFHKIVIDVGKTHLSEESVVCGMSAVLERLGSVGAEIRAAMSPDSPGGTTITAAEKDALITTAMDLSRDLLEFVYSLCNHNERRSHEQ